MNNMLRLAAFLIALSFNSGTARAESAVRIWILHPQTAVEADLRGSAASRVLTLKLLGENASSRRATLGEPRRTVEYYEAPRWAVAASTQRAALQRELLQSWPRARFTIEDPAPPRDIDARAKVPVVNGDLVRKHLQAALPPGIFDGWEARKTFDGSLSGQDGGGVVASRPGGGRPTATLTAAGPRAIKTQEAPPAPRPFETVIYEEAKAAGADPEQLHALINAMGGYREKFSAGRAYGLMHVSRPTARSMGVDPDRLREGRFGVRAGARYWAHLDKVFEGDLTRMVYAYRLGETAVIRSGGLPRHKGARLFAGEFHKALRAQPEPVIAPASPILRQAKEVVRERVAYWAAQFGTEPELLEAVTRAGNGKITMSRGTAKDMGVRDRSDTDQRLMGAAKYLAQLQKRFGGDPVLTVAGYYDGPNRSIYKQGRIRPGAAGFTGAAMEAYSALTGKTIDLSSYTDARPPRYAPLPTPRPDRTLPEELGSALDEAVKPVEQFFNGLSRDIAALVPWVEGSVKTKGQHFGAGAGMVGSGLRLPKSGLGYRSTTTQNWGTGRMVRLIQFVGAYAHQSGLPELNIRDISKEGGGRLGWYDKKAKRWRGHKSHRIGLDADIRNIFRPGRWVTVRGKRVRQFDFDTEKNWTLLRGILLYRAAGRSASPVQYVFTSQSNKSALLAYSKIYDPAFHQEAHRVLNVEPGHGAHYHVRLYR